MDAQQIQQVTSLVTAASPFAIAAASSPVALKLIDKIGDYLGERRRPNQIIKEGEAQAYADARGALIKRSLDPSASEEERQLARGFLAEEHRVGREQRNKESIVLKALPGIQENARPEDVSEDFFANFFDKGRLISDEEMQLLWAKLLAGEVNEPGTFSRRTLSLLANLDKSDAQHFLTMCRFALTGSGIPDIPLIYETHDSIYNDAGVTFSVLQNLSSMGLISFEMTDFESILSQDKPALFSYHQMNFVLKWPDNWDHRFKRGRVTFTDTGDQFARLCSPQPVEGFENYLVEKWKTFGYKVTVQRPGEPPYEA